MAGGTSWRQWVVTAICLPVGLVAFATFVGLGGARQSQAEAVMLAAMALVFLPPIGTALVAPTTRLGVFGLATAAWSAALLLIVPVYFPGERQDAVSTGIAMLTRSARWEDMARSVSETLPLDVAPDSERVSILELTRPPGEPPGPPSATATLIVDWNEDRPVVSATLVQGTARVDARLALSAEGEVTQMRPQVLEALGVDMAGGATEVTVATPAGQTLVPLSLLDAIVLDTLSIPGVGVVPCEACPDGVDGIIGGNLRDVLNWTADSEAAVTIELRDGDRLADVRPFVAVAGRFQRASGGLVQVELGAANRALRAVNGAVVRIRCGDRAWRVELGTLASEDRAFVRRRLPQHPRCGAYQVELDAATW